MAAAPEARRLTITLASYLLVTNFQWAAAQIRVMSPPELVNTFESTGGRIDGSTATFGAPFYGERLVGRLVWGDSKKGRHHCTADDYDVPPPDQIPDGEHRERQLIHIIMVRRGLCSFVEKVKTAISKGAHAVVIVDGENATHDLQHVVVADNGHGTSIRVPSLLISHEAGEHLIEAARREQVIVELAWDVPTNHIVLMDLWMSSGSRESQRFLGEFAPKRRALNEAMTFVPHYAIFAQPSPSDNLCLDAEGQFCAEDPDAEGRVTGRDVVLEDLRQLCIHELTRVKRSVHIGRSSAIHSVEYAGKWWDYVERFPLRCPFNGQEADARFGLECSEKLMREVGVDVGAVQTCVANTRDAKLKEQRRSVAWSPRALRINGWRYSGTMDADLVMRAVCAGYVEQPPECETLVEPRKVLLERMSPKQGVSSFSLVGAFLVISSTAVCALFLYRKRLTNHIHSALREEVMLEVQAQAGAYKQLSS